MDANKPKEGVSVREIEDFTKKHRFEVFFCLSFILACFFNFVFFGTGWGIIFAAVGGVLGVVSSAKVELFMKKGYHFVFKQEQITQLVLGVVWLILSVFLPPLIWFVVGLNAGKCMHHQAMELFSSEHRHH
jgi:hypothetical protein